LSDGDPLAALDARIAVLRTIRAATERFGVAYWEADDAISWLRIARDELARTGRLRNEVRVFLEIAPAAVAVAPDAAIDPTLVAMDLDANSPGPEPDAREAARPPARGRRSRGDVAIPQEVG